jgi:uncharacterized damage-inducible protein DinB
MKIYSEFINESVRRIEINLPRIERCFNELDEEDIWRRPNYPSNSVGNLVLHLCGNITQYIISSIGGEEDNRRRDEEFSAEGGYTKAELLSKITEVINRAVRIIKGLNENDLLRVGKVQVYEMSGIAKIIHVTEHLSFHTGQIVFWTKLLKEKDLGFYKGTKL